jgi:hypothetical protein
MSQERIKDRIRDAGGNLIGNIVLYDKNPNLVSVITIVKWMTTGEKFGKGLYASIFPPSGVSVRDIQESGKFGLVILNAFQTANLSQLQDNLLKEGAVKVSPVLASIEKRGKMMFGIWSKFILKKGSYNSPERVGRLKLFKYYLFAVIYLVSPIVSFLFYTAYKVNRQGSKKLVDYYSHNDFR